MSERINQYLLARKKASAMMNEAIKIEREAFQRVEGCGIPENIRPAVASDIVEGAVIWYAREDESYFRIVADVICQSDPWKAYCASDGSRDGLYNAYVEVESPAKKRYT